MQGKPFKIYRSSAGSGKTYTLAQEYLKIALKNPQGFRQILAVTFTNKAMQEMKSRIIANLHEISNGADTAMTATLQEYLNISAQELSDRAKLTLSFILHNYSFFAVSTIDSFFQKVIRAFTKEIGLQTGFKLELDQGKVISEVIDKVIAEIGEDAQLTQWLVQFADAKVNEGKSWDIKGDIGRLAGELLKEHFKLFEEDILKISKDPRAIPLFRQKLFAMSDKYEQQMDALANEALKLMECHGLTIDDFSGKRRSIVGYFENVLAKKYEISDNRRSAADNVENWFTKTSPKKHLITQAYEQGLNQSLKAIIAYYDSDNIYYETATQIQKLIYTLGVMGHIAKKLQEYRDEHDVLLISDASILLKGIIGENDAPFIYEKVGANFKHFLIDEFQDTSGFQWDNFKPLLQNSIAEGNSSLVVGDIKQAIYRWRGGDWKLLLEQIQEDIGEQNTEILNLNHNWRSKKNIIDFNNSLFNSAVQVLENCSFEKIDCLENENLKNKLLTDAGKVIKAYHDVFQQAPKKKEAGCPFHGYIHMVFLPKKIEETEEDEAIGWKDEVLQRLPRQLEDLQRKGYQLRDICFLVRSKKDGKLIADMLMEYKCSESAQKDCSYEVISSESLQLGSARSIQILLAALQFLDNEEDTISLATLAHHYQRYVLGNMLPDPDALFSAAANGKAFLCRHYLPADFSKKFGYLKKLPLFELVEELIRLFSLPEMTGEFAYLQSFQDVALEFNREEKAEIHSFLIWWEENCDKKTVKISEELNAMRILTIHKAKGLQWKVVLVPFCDWNLDHESYQNNILWCKSDEAPFDEVNHLPLLYSSSLAKTIYSGYYFEEMIKAQMDALNLLYVAFTRAEECLFTFGPAPKEKAGKSFDIKCISSLMYSIFSEAYTSSPVLSKALGGHEYIKLNGCWKPELMTFEIGQMPHENKRQEIEETLKLQKYHAHAWRNRLTVKKRASEIFTEDAETLQTRINHGLLIHELMAKITTKAQLPHALEELRFSGALSSEAFGEIRHKIEILMDHPQVANWFGGEWEVKTEVPVLPRSGEMKRLDRVMLKKNEAVIVDFKSKSKSSSDHLQVKEYATLLSGMGYDKVQGYLLYIENTEVIRVV